jgi:parallel beta-helix repeat protein
MSRTMQAAAILAVLAVHAAPVLADESRIPIAQPTTISQPGHYILTRDITVAGGNVITIQAGDVTLDLNGRNIQSGAATGALILILPGATDVTVRNGRLLGGMNGVVYASTSIPLRVRLENLEIRNSSIPIQIDGADSVEILNCRISDATGGRAIEVFGTSGAPVTGRIVGNTIKDVAGFGMLFSGLRDGEIRGNIITHFGTAIPGEAGIEITNLTTPLPGGNIIEGNIIRQSDDDLGILIYVGDGNLLMNNTVSSVGSTGIQVSSSGNRLVGNVVSGAVYGITVNLFTGSGPVNNNIVERNEVSGSSQIGIVASGNYDLLDSNVVEGSGSFGLQFTGTGHAYRNNMLRNNAAGPVTGVATDAGGNII